MAKDSKPKVVKNTSKMRVVIGMPLSDSVAMKAKTAHSIVANTIHSGVVTNFILKISCDIVNNRTELVKDAIADGATHLLFVDYDMQFPADTLERLLAHDKDIVGVQYNKRQLPLVPVIDLGDEKKDTLYKVKAAGTGVMLVRLSIFEKMQNDVWFNFGRDSEGKTVLGEDVWFCRTAGDRGIETWIDPTIHVAHLGEYGY